MKSMTRSRLLVLFLLGAFLIAVSTAGAQTFEIGTWGNFCQGALSHTFDDYPNYGATHIVSTGRDAFDAKKFHMTIFTITSGDNTSTWTALDSAFTHGHEIASHSVTHPSGTMPASELGPSQLAIQQHVPGEKCATIAYPNCNTPGDNQVLQYYIAGRNCNGATNPKTPANWAQIAAKGFGTGQGGYPNDVTSLNNFANGAASSNGWAVAMHHGIGTDTHTWAVTNLDTLIKHLAYLDQNRDKIWVETFGNVARYIRERDSSKITVKSSSSTSITIAVTNNLGKDSIFNYPLSIRTQRPSGWTTVTVKQAGKTVWDSIVTVGTTPYIMFKAVPDAGDVVLSSNVSPVIRRLIGRASGNTAPVMRQKATLLIDSRQFGSSGCDVTFFTLQGKLLAHYRLAAHESSIALAIDKFNCSAFLVKITGGNKTYIGKFIPQ